MIIPSQEECVRVIKELAEEPALSPWEREFVTANLYRMRFSDPQRMVVGHLLEKFELRP